MNGTLGFREVRSSTSRSSAYRFLDKQQPQSETVADTISSLNELGNEYS